MSKPAKPPFIVQTTGDPYLDLGAAMVGQAIDDLLDPLHGSSARAFLANHPIARTVIAMLEADGHDFERLAAARRIRN